MNNSTVVNVLKNYVAIKEAFKDKTSDVIKFYFTMALLSRHYKQTFYL